MLAPGTLRALAAIDGPGREACARAGRLQRRSILRINAGVTYIGDNSKARRELGYHPRPLRDGFAQTLRHEMRLLGMADDKVTRVVLSVSLSFEFSDADPDH